MNTSGGTLTTLSLPKGGGAIKGIGETFQANLFSGTGNHSVPIALSPGRGGFGPALSLGYSSGNGNSLFGLGWQLSQPRITRKTEKGLPRYDDSDVFVLSGSEDLVPWLTNGVPEQAAVRGEHTVSRYRPRTEGSFARIERWVHTPTRETHWRTISKDNITSLFGTSAASRLADPADDRRVYEWLLAETYDALGNHSCYEYAADEPALYGDDAALRLPEVFERNRLATNRYPRRMFYGNLPEPLLDAEQHPITYADGSAVGVLRDGRRYVFEVVFDYGDLETPTGSPHPEPPTEDEPELLGPEPGAPIRTDRFSVFRSGFEIRTLRRCRRVLMFHHFAELGGPTLVRSTDFGYATDADTRASLLSAVTVRGYDRDSEGRYRSAAMPALTFGYTAFEPRSQHFRPLRARGGELPPLGLQQPGMALVDLFGDGLPDVLHTGPAGFRYWRNLGDGTLDRPRTLPEVPAGISLDQPGVGFGDMAGNGIADLLVNTGPLAGFFETTSEGAWKKFTPYATSPGFDPQDRGVRLLDLTGDGRADALMTTDEQFLVFECLGEQGFAAPRSIARSHDLDAFPDVFFDDPAGRFRLADMSGDGLNDIVLIHGGRVDYWPNLGYGRFGGRISMAHAPLLDGDLDPRRIFLADLNGTGCADLVYVDARRIHFWFNRSGNTWSERQTLLGTPLTSDPTGVEFADLFGTGTAALVWSRNLGAPGESNYAALDFCGGVKPYVLVGLDNNLGATTRVTYAPSTRYYLDDQAAGTPWITALPFPVQVVEKVEVVDHVGGTTRVSTYRYHHGHYDGREREFCGFGRVDQFDAESFDGTGGAHEVPPVETRSWFHTGVYAVDLTARFRQEWFAGDSEAVPLAEHDVEVGDAPAEAYRALRGAQLRTEVYGHDGSIRADHPYEAAETRYRVSLIQPKATNHHAVFLAHQVETLSYHYERNPNDPRISHALTLEVDGFGNPLRALNIGYGRRRPDPSLPTDADRERQGRALITFTQTRHTIPIDDPLTSPDTHRMPVPCETSTYELTGFAPRAPGAERFDYAEWVAGDFARLEGAQTIGYEEEPDSAVPQRRLIEHVRTFFRRDDLAGDLPLGAVESLALAGERRKLAFTSGLVLRIYDDRVDDETLAELGYLRGEDGSTWWIHSGRIFCSPADGDAPAAELDFARAHYFLPHRTRDPFGNNSTTRYDPYALLVTESTDAVANRIRAEHDYRLLQPFRLTDPNGNRGEVVFDTLGMVAGSAVMGKVAESVGDSLAGFAANLTADQRAAFFADPLASAALLLGSATSRIIYDLDRYQREGQPACAATLSRETHASDPPPVGELKVQLGLGYSDGFGRVIQQKVPAEPGPVVDGGPVVSPRWVGSGWTIFNNKGKPVRQFEPFFDDTPAFRSDHLIGVSSTLLYDPLERVVATLHPNDTWEKVAFDPWQHASWDVNDTLLIDKPNDDPDIGSLLAGLDPSVYLPTWFSARAGGELGPAEQAAATKAAGHAETPTIAYADALGRPFLTVAHNRYEREGQTVEELHASRVVLDIEGRQRDVVDALGRVVMRHDYDMLGTLAYRTSMESGQRWMLADVAGQPCRGWDDRGHGSRIDYEPLRRPVRVFVRGADPTDLDRELLTERLIYGEHQVEASQRNLRGRTFLHLDQSGMVGTDRYDFAGNPLTVTHRLARDYKGALDWSAVDTVLAGNPTTALDAVLEAALDSMLEAETFTDLTRYDALNRPIQLTAPHRDHPDARRHVIQPVYNEAKLLERLDVWLDQAADPAGLLDPAVVPVSPVGVAAIDYDALGQRTSISYTNGVRATYAYDPQTFHLTHLVTSRPGADGRVQDLSYTYDPVGNITGIRDDAQQTIFFRNVRVEPSADYTYDAVYRLIGATGREHLGHAGDSPVPGSYDDVPRIGQLLSAGDGTALGRYLERYLYDPAGNLTQLVHRGSDPASPGWIRDYAYAESGQLEADRLSNRLTSTTIGATTEEYSTGGDGYDAHGNLLRMPHLATMAWDYRDQLALSQRQAVNADDADGALHQGERTYYVYDTAGQRTRKVTERADGTRKAERLYFGGTEVFRSYDPDGRTVHLERETLHVVDGSRRIAVVETRTLGDDGSPARLIRYQLDNHLGSVSLELDERAQLVSYEEYYPYGGTAHQAGRSAVEVNLKRYRLSGLERDEETGLSHHGARYYASWLGRWTSADPVGLSADGLNLYAFVGDNPVGKVDPSGHEGEKPDQKNQASASANMEFRHDRLMNLHRYLVVHGIEIPALTHLLAGFGDNATLAPYGYNPGASDDKETFNLHVRRAITNYDIHWQADQGHPYQSTMSAPSAAQIAHEANQTFIGSVLEAYEIGRSSAAGMVSGGTVFTITGDPELAKHAAALGAAVGGAVTPMAQRVAAGVARRRGGGGGGGGGAGGAGGAAGGPPAGPSAGGEGSGPVRLVSRVFRWAPPEAGQPARDFVVVETSIGRQGFYRSSGQSSGMRDAWLPFDEIYEHDAAFRSKGWVNKNAYTNVGNGLERFGSEEFMSISAQLTSMSLPAGAIVKEESHVNDLLNFFDARISDRCIFRPIPFIPRAEIEFTPWPKSPRW